MGPDYGTSAYKNQVETIKMRLRDVDSLVKKQCEIPLTGSAEKCIVVGKVAMMFIQDPEYSRAAICQALNEWKQEFNRSLMGEIDGIQS